MNQNDKIRQIKEKNYNTNPVNIEPFVNPFLRLSDNQVLNKLLNHSLPKPGASNQNSVIVPTSSTGSIRRGFPNSNQRGGIILDGPG